MALIMLDLETLGTTANSIITNIGAFSLKLSEPVQYDNRVTTDYIERGTFEAAFNIQEQMDKGRVTTESTIKWWLTQSDAARAKLAAIIPYTIGHNMQVLKGFAQYCKNIRDVDGELTVWGNGADFDNALLGNLYDMYGLPRPWAHYENRCYRTIKALANDKHKAKTGDNFSWGVPELAHDALSDAKAQALNAVTALRMLAA